MILNYKYKPRGYQKSVISAFDKGCKRIVWTCSRRGGKDLTALNIMIAEALKRKGLYFYCFPSYSQAKKVIYEGMTNEGTNFLDFIPPELIRKKNATDLSLELTNGSIIRFVGVSEVDSLVGTNPLGIIFSEAALIPERAWHFLSPILSANNGWAIFISTPRGMNWYYNLYTRAKNEKKWYTQFNSVKNTDYIKADILEDEKRNLPKILYQQEYECLFQDGADQVFKEFNSIILPNKFIPDSARSYKLGIDLGKAVDWTAIAVLDLHNWHVQIDDRFQKDDWTIQQAKIDLASQKWNQAGITLDSTGLGGVVSDYLKKSGIYIDDFTFTGDSRTKLLLNLKMLMDKQDIKIVRDEVLIDELRSFRYDVHISPTGKSRISMVVPEGRHDDTVMALALACHNLQGKISEPGTLSWYENEFGGKIGATDGEIPTTTRFHY